MSKNLVIYFSHIGENYFDGQLREISKGNTEIVAEYIRDSVGADLFHVDTLKAYANGYYDCCDEAKKELRENARPILKKEIENIEDYENIFVGYPIWWGTMPMAMFTQLEKLNFDGKKVLPFCTHEGSGLANSVHDLERICKGAKMQKGLAIQGSEAKKSRDLVEKWAKKSI